MNVGSTRGAVADLPLADALLRGTAPDGGLFVPARLPRGEVRAPRDPSLGESAVAVLSPFFVGERLEPALPAMVSEAFSFPAPLVPLRGPDDFVLELFHGPTAAFKDFGARFLAACVRRLQPARGRPRTVLVATSGDTGAAVAAAFHRMPGVRVVVLYPDGRVSPRQAHQLGAFGDNVTALRVAGTFDDCQRMVKAAFADPGLAPLQLTSANSISLGRLLPQLGYHAHAAWISGSTLNLVVPTGNLGNALAAVWAREIGAPIGDIVLATNANPTLSEFWASGVYRGRPSVATLANAMDVGDPSNFERLAWTFPDPPVLRSALRARAVSDADIIPDHPGGRAPAWPGLLSTHRRRGSRPGAAPGRGGDGRVGGGGDGASGEVREHRRASGGPPGRGSPRPGRAARSPVTRRAARGRPCRPAPLAPGPRRRVSPDRGAWGWLML